jgi:hypothetical protein
MAPRANCQRNGPDAGRAPGAANLGGFLPAEPSGGLGRKHRIDAFGHLKFRAHQAISLNLGMART